MKKSSIYTGTAHAAKFLLDLPYCFHFLQFFLPFLPKSIKNIFFLNNENPLLAFWLV